MVHRRIGRYARRALADHHAELGLVMDLADRSAEFGSPRPGRSRGGGLHDIKGSAASGCSSPRVILVIQPDRERLSTASRTEYARAGSLPARVRRSLHTLLQRGKPVELRRRQRAGRCRPIPMRNERRIMLDLEQPASLAYRFLSAVRRRARFGGVDRSTATTS